MSKDERIESFAMTSMQWYGNSYFDYLMNNRPEWQKTAMESRVFQKASANGSLQMVRFGSDVANVQQKHSICMALALAA